MALDEVLCTVCGHQLKSRIRAESAKQRETASSSENPYATPDGSTNSSLSEEAEGRAESVISSANSVNANSVAGLCLLLAVLGVCIPLWLLVLPWSTYQYLRWRRLHAQFPALRRETSYSPHGDIAARFQAAGSRLRLCIALGAFPWFVLAILIIFQLLSAAFAPA
jgi:hypothetical protein